MLQHRDKHDWISSCCSLSLFFSECHIPVDAKVNSACPMLLPPILTHILSFCGSRIHLTFTCDSLQMISISRTGEGLVRTSSLWASRHSKRLLMSCEPSRTLSMHLLCLLNRIVAVAPPQFATEPLLLVPLTAHPGTHVRPFHHATEGHGLYRAAPNELHRNRNRLHQCRRNSQIPRSRRYGTRTRTFPGGHCR